MSIIRFQDPFDLAPANISALFDRFFNESARAFNKNAAFVPSVDVLENPTQYELHVAVPGMKKEDFKLALEDNKLTISGERKSEHEEKSATLHKVETQYGSFLRSFTLPNNVNRDGIEAKYEDGLLKVVLPKTEQTKTTTQINVN